MLETKQFILLLNPFHYKCLKCSFKAGKKVTKYLLKLIIVNLSFYDLKSLNRIIFDSSNFEQIAAFGIWMHLNLFRITDDISNK